MNQMDGVINVKDLFAEIIRKSWLIIICTVLFAFMLGSYAYIKNIQNSKSLEEVESILTEEELEAADLYVEKIVQFLNMEDYMETSILTNCDPYNVYQTQIQYVISDIENDTDVSTIRTCYEKYVSGGYLANDIAKIDKDYAGKVLLDAIKIESSTFVQSDDLKLVSIQFIAIDEEQTEELASYVKEMIENYSVVVKDEIGYHEVKYLNEATITDLDYEFIKLRGNLTSLYDFLEEEFQTMATGLSSAQMRYAVDALSEILDEDVLVELGIEVGSDTADALNLLKYIVLGGAIGFAGAIVLVVALYFFTSQIKSEKEIEYLYGLTHYGNCPVFKRNIFDKIADALLYKGKLQNLDETRSEIVKALGAVCREEKITKLGFVCDVDVLVKGVLDEMCKTMNAQGVQTTILEHISDNNAELPKDIVIVALVKKTTMPEIVKTIEECNEKGIALRGYITFSK